MLNSECYYKIMVLIFGFYCEVIGLGWKRSERLIDMTYYLLSHPRELTPLTYFSDKYGAAKSSISEDLTILKEILQEEGHGQLVTVPGARGGVIYYPSTNEHKIQSFIQNICTLIQKPDRILPGGYLYLADIIGNPKIVEKVGKMFASLYSHQKIDAVMTVATKGIPLAYATAKHLNVPVVIVRRDPEITEGSMVSINYVSGSTKRIQTMTLARRSLQEGSSVLIVDDFMKAGGTIRGMISLLDEFHAEVAGICVLVESEGVEKRLIDQYVSVVRLTHVNGEEEKIEVEEGNYLQFFKKMQKIEI